MVAKLLVNPRLDDEIWHLVGFDPVCRAMMSIRDNLLASYPSEIAHVAVALAELVFNETYDRIEGGSHHDVPALQNAGS